MRQNEQTTREQQQHSELEHCLCLDESQSRTTLTWW